MTTGLRNGDRIVVTAPDKSVSTTATYVGFVGGPTALVELDGTGALVNVPREWIAKDFTEKVVAGLTTVNGSATVTE